MKQVLTQVKYHLYNTIRDREFMFYILILPLVLAGLYYVTMSNIDTEPPASIPVGVAESSGDVSYQEVFQAIDIIDAKTMTEAQAESAFDKGDIDAFVQADGSLVIEENGLNQTIVKTVTDEVKQVTALGMSASEMNFDRTYTNQVNTPAPYITVVFYGLLAMIAFYASFAGIEIPKLLQANMSQQAVRISIAPINRTIYLVSMLIIYLVLNLIANTFVLVLLDVILDMNLITHLGTTYLLLTVGNFLAISFGILVGFIPKISEEAKTNFALGIVLVLTFLAGGMVPGIQNTVNQYAPWINTFNPIGILTENLYRVNALNDFSQLTLALITMAGAGLLCTAFALFYTRGKRYDSV